MVNKLRHRAIVVVLLAVVVSMVVLFLWQWWLYPTLSHMSSATVSVHSTAKLHQPDMPLPKGRDLPADKVPQQQWAAAWQASIDNATLAFAALPIWMQDYVIWHHTQVQRLSADNWRTYRFVVARCLDSDVTCGGLSDRLKPLPTLVLLAAQSRRILLLHWTRPTLLTHFMVPPVIHDTADGTKIVFNWTRPDFVPVTGLGTRLYTKLATLTKAIRTNSTIPVLCVRLQDQHGGSEYYNAHHPHTLAMTATRNDNNSTITTTTVAAAAQLPQTSRAYRKVYRNLFLVAFAPSPPVFEQLWNTVQTWRLYPNEYVVGHLRADYGPQRIPPDQLASVALNTVQCASHLVSSQTQTTTLSDYAVNATMSQPIVFLSDSTAAMQQVALHAPQAAQRGYTIVTLDPNSAVVSEPLHLDKASSVTAADYYNVFVDALIMANAKCVVHGPGGFGRLGALLSYNPMCIRQTVELGRYIQCPWARTEPS
jgi:hypothetical protein